MDEEALTAMDEGTFTLEEQSQFLQDSLHTGVEDEEESTFWAEDRKDNEGVEGGEAPPDPQKDFIGYIQWLGKELQAKRNSQLYGEGRRKAGGFEAGRGEVGGKGIGTREVKELEAGRKEAGEVAAEEVEVSKKEIGKVVVGGKDVGANASLQEAEQLRSFFHQSSAAIKQKHHDFDQAANFVYDMRATQLAACAALYPEMADPKVVEAIISDELKTILRDCAHKNQNPAEVIYTIAQKIGYTTPQTETIDTLQAKHNSARTLAAYNGLGPRGPISLEMLDKMSEAEFSVWIDDPKNKTTFNRLMGGVDI
ncbi:hypothetical protein [Bartonella bacilliformis]|uniref:Uncharacterized protein n=1 Tax=Bartonella bacilliformis Ver097 TaxID=1293911 RepID=A0A072R3V7_BARBA|nr:hypothetical protein [Bartonella bacilliformis]KEG20326.1 hypothetical protein H710_00401 [Bartonella bacilliformis Ver097]